MPRRTRCAPSAMRMVIRQDRQDFCAKAQNGIGTFRHKKMVTIASERLRCCCICARPSTLVTCGPPIRGRSIEDSVLRIDRLTPVPAKEADDLFLDLCRRLPEARISDLMLEVDAVTGLAEAFTHLRTEVLCSDKIGFLNVLLTEGLNLGLSKMAGASNAHDYRQLFCLSRSHVESDAMNRSLAMLVGAQAKLPMAQVRGAGQTASSDGHVFPTTRQRQIG
jgi:hypothetical protein